MKRHNLILTLISAVIASAIIAGCGEEGNTEGIKSKEDEKAHMEKIEETPGGTPADPNLIDPEDGP